MSGYLAIRRVLIVLSFLPNLSKPSPVPTTAIGTCTITKWQHILVFFISNYLAHAASVPNPAGTKWRDALRWPLLATFLPFAGLGRSISLISRYIACGYRQGDLKQAFVSNAVAVVARSSDWELPDNEQLFLLPEVENYDKTFLESKPATIVFDYFDHAIVPKYYSIHGSITLPFGYKLVSPTLSDLNHVVSNELEPMPGLQLSRSRNWAKAIISIAQLVFSSITIYRTRGDQLDRYGYAAYGLSVFPYTFMSLANLVCSALIGEYPSIYVLKSMVMKEAEERQGGLFHGAIGTLRHMNSVSDGHDICIHLTDPAFTVEDKSGNVQQQHFRSCAHSFITTAANDACINDVDATHVGHSIARNNPNEGLAESAEQNNRATRQTAFGFREASSGCDKQLIVTVDKVSKVFKFRKSAGRHDRGVHRFPLPSVTDRFVDGGRRASRIINLGRGMMVLPLLLLPYVFIYCLSLFKKGHSTVAQRGWMMAWICANQVSYFPVAWMSGNKPICRLSFRSGIETAVLVSFCVLLSISAVGGYIEVWKMISESAGCSSL